MNDLAPDLIRFVFEFIHSIEQLEVLLLLRENSSNDWSITKVNDIIRSDPDSIRGRLRQLEEFNLVSQTGPEVFRYARQSADRERIVSDLATAYRERRTRIIELVYSKSKRDLHNFSSAFVVIKKDQKDG